MICVPCRTAADKGEQGWEAHQARGCKGDCTCMHRVGTPEVLLNQERIERGREPR